MRNMSLLDSVRAMCRRILPILLSACSADGTTDGVASAEVRDVAVVQQGVSAAVTNPDKSMAYGQSIAAQAAVGLVDRRGLRTVWAKMKQKPDLSGAAATSDWTLRGALVHTTLTNTARSSQTSLLSYLEAQQIAHQSFWITNVIKVRADEKTVRAIAQRSDVAGVLEDHPLAIVPHKRLSLAVTPQEVVWNIQSIRAPEVWNTLGTRGEGIVVATIDTGVEYSHPALVAQYRGRLADGTFDHNYSWYDPSAVCGAPPSAAPCDNVGHGTHTMGTLVGDDGGGHQIGVAPGAKWITAKGCEDYGCTVEALLASGQWMLAPTDLTGQNPRPELRPHIVSNAWGENQGDAFYLDVVRAWIAAGIFPIFSVGGEGPSCGSLGSPGDYSESYAVGAYDSALNIAFFSGRGPASNGEIKPNIAAPGVSIWSSVPGGYEYYDGTSMATSHVAGTVALMWSTSTALVGDIEGTRELLAASAIDHDDESCGGTPELNNVWGEGQLDAFGAVQRISPVPAGSLSGLVSQTSGTPIPGAKIRLTGSTERTVLTGPDGHYFVKAPVGIYAVTASAFAFYSKTVNEVELTEELPNVQDFALENAPTYTVAGTVRDDEGEAVMGATVTLAATPLQSVRTDASGAFLLESVPAGDFALTVNAGGCLAPVTMPLTVDGPENVPVTMQSRSDGYGYACRIVPLDYIQADAPVALSGDDQDVEIVLPFEFPYYGIRYAKARISTNGYLTFKGAATSFYNQPIPDMAEPNAALFALWDDNYVDELSRVATRTVGTAPSRRFVVEWRNIEINLNPDTRATFELVLSENGEIRFQYSSSDSAGESATVGIENSTGTIGLQYSYLEPTISSGLALSFKIPHSGVAQGTVIDQNDGLCVANAEVVAADAAGKMLKTSTDEQGRYAFQTRAGPYTLSVNKRNYASANAPVSVIEGSTINQDFRLQTPRAEVAPTILQWVVPANATRTRGLTLSNTGTVPMAYQIHESGGKRQSTKSKPATPRITGAPLPFATRATKGAYGQASAAGWAPMDTGDILFSFIPADTSAAWGIGFGGTLWVSDVDTVQNREFTVEGLPTGRQWDASWSGHMPADMAYDASRELMCQLAATTDGRDSAIYCWEPTSGRVIDVIAGTWSQNTQLGLAYRADDDSFYVGGPSDGIIYHVEGLSGLDRGRIVSSCSPPDSNISGLAYNEGVGVLWVATSSSTDTIYELNPEDCSVLGTLKHPQSGGYQGAGLDLDNEGNLWIVGQYPSKVYLVDSGVPDFNDVPWLTVAPTSGNVAAGSNQPLGVTVNTAGLEPGVHLGSIFVSSNSGRVPQLRVPVSLTVSAYQQGVNVGGKAYVDTNGDPWAPDQAWKVNGWGYVQKGSLTTTDKDIAGTTEQKLFQSQRVDPYAYRFDNVPNGMYQVELRFAELQAATKVGQRLFDVIVENTVVLPGHDIVFDVGPLAADVHNAFVEVSDNRMDVRLVPTSGSKLPVINALRVTQRPDRQ